MCMYEGQTLTGFGALQILELPLIWGWGGLLNAPVN